VSLIVYDRKIAERKIQNKVAECGLLDSVDAKQQPYEPHDTNWKRARKYAMLDYFFLWEIQLTI